MARVVLLALAAALGRAALMLLWSDDEADRGATFLDSSSATQATRNPDNRQGPHLASAGRRPEPQLLTATAFAPTPEAASRLRKLEALWKRALALLTMEHALFLR